MMADASAGDSSLLTVRRRWQEVLRRQPSTPLRVGLLASYTVDPLVPYLGMGLHDAGLPSALSVGPFNQILQQCLDDDGVTARHQPDVLVVAPRFEELGGLAGEHPGAGDEWTDDLLRLSDVALAAAERWRACLVYVLPAIPEDRPLGVGDAGDLGGVAASATLARTALRTRLAGLPDVLLADAEEAVREIGSRDAHHPALFRFAKVPYTETWFASLGAQLVRLLRLRYGLAPRAAILDADSLLSAAAAAAPQATADALRAVLQELRQAGVRLAARGGGDPNEVWGALASALPDLLDDLLDTSAIDDRPVAEQVRAIAAAADVPAAATVLLTTDPALATGTGDQPAAGSAVLLGDDPESWPALLRAAGMFDRLPEPMADDQRGGAFPARAAHPRQTTSRGLEPPLTTADFVASLNVVVAYLPVEHGDVAKVAELVERAKGFTLGIPHTARDITSRAEDIFAVAVRDRFGDYGISAAVAMCAADGVCTVDLFSVSCPVLGKEVEDRVLRELVARADREGCATVVFRYRPTGQNDVAQRFLRNAVARPWPAGSDREIRLRIDELTGERA